jgi:hypothetical protein
MQSDEWTERLAHLFREHPAWRSAARSMTDDATSTVYFSQRPGEPWRLERRDGETFLLRGAAEDPDFVFRFSPRAIDALDATDGAVGDFAVALFSLIEEDEIQLRIVAGFGRLARRGYLKLLWLGGLPVLRFGARRGIHSVAGLRRLVAQLRRTRPADWER